VQVTRIARPLLGVAFFVVTSATASAFAASTRANAAKNYGGPVDFGVRFSAVTPVEARRFWSAYTDPKSLTRNLTTDLDRPLASDHPVRVSASHAANHYVSALSGWVKSLCASPDMNAFNQGQLTYTTPTRLLPSEYYAAGDAPSQERLNKKYPNLNAFWSDARGFNNPYLSIYKCNFVRGDEIFNMEEIGSAQWQLVPDPSRTHVSAHNEFAGTVYVGLNALNRQTQELWSGTRFTVRDEAGVESPSGPGVYLTGISFWVVNDYLVPAASHSLSKAFPVPVARFDPVTGEILEYLDFGLLLIEGLPQEYPPVLTTVMSADRVQQFQKTRDANALGILQPLMKKSAHQYIPAGLLPAGGRYWNYDRIPVGSIHFMINAFWSDAYAADASESALLFETPTSTLRRLYLDGHAWINTYDHILETGSTPRPLSYLELMAGRRVGQLTPENMPAGMWMSHEIIIGGTLGRQILFKESKIVPVTNCTPYLAK